MSKVKNGPQVTLNLSSNMVNLMWVCKAFTNVSQANIKFSKIQLSKMVHSGGFFGRLLGPKKPLKTKLT